MNDTDVETRLRAAFAAAERVIVDDDNAPEILREPARMPRRKAAVWALAAAAAVVVAVAGLAIGLRSDRHAVAPGPAQSQSATTSEPTPVQPIGPQAKACDVALPAAWGKALTAGRVPGYLDLRAVDAAGNAYAAQLLGRTSQLVQISPDRSPLVIYRAPAGSRVGDVSVDGRWLSATLIVGTVPGGHSGEQQGSVAGIVGIDLNSVLSVRTVRSTALGTKLIVQPPVVAHGIVYWTESSTAGTGRVYAYSLATRQRRTLDSGAVTDPVALGGGVYWSNGRRLVTHVMGDLPIGFSPYPGKGYGNLFHSHGVDAWAVSVGANLEVKMVGAGAPVTVVRPTNPDQLLVPYGLSGDLLVYDDGQRLHALDWQTGAATTLPGLDAYGAGAGGGVLALETAEGALSMVHTADLPRLTC